MWYKKLGGRKFAGFLIGLVGISYFVVILAFISMTEMFVDLAKFVMGYTLIGIIAYITGNVIQHIKGNGGDNVK